ncbi:uncharacterized protein LOC111343106 isoform X2 [Stylophora pistillata]|uniref:uncharacterized protein LOC111343106 isoform X2 n=1 Tax=Stylophora pistillata TaxID=50429 RepID=UPI000C047BD4|nr:uncharacterized protein LOC111343106 isoform X2 [Stylophora pistillata]
MTSYLTGTEILKEEEDLGTFHPKQMQCDRPDAGNELCTLAEETSGKNEDCTDPKGTKEIFYEDLEKSLPKKLKIGPLKEEGYELTDEALEDNMDCTQLDNSPEPCSEECGDVERDCDQLNELYFPKGLEF